MIFGAWPMGVVLAGVAGLAAGLFFLQQLRTRYRDVTVVTTIFWKQVSHEAPVRTLRERFRHPLAYLLVLAITTLVWLGLSDPQWRTASTTDTLVVIVDGSAGMGRADRLARAFGEAESIVRDWPADRRAVLWAGASVQTLLAPREETLLFRTRTVGRPADAAPPAVGQAIRAAVVARPAGGRTRVVVVGDAPVGPEAVAALPAGVTVTRASRPEAPVANAGITALGVAESGSGAWDRVDVLAAIERRPGTEATSVVLSLDGRMLPPETIERTPWPDGRGESVRVRELPAAGGLLEARLSGDAIQADDAASLRLPRRPVLRVRVSPSLASIVTPVLEADNGIEIVSSSSAPDVVIRRAGEISDVVGPSLEFVDPERQPTAFLLTHPVAVDASDALTAAVEGLGLRQIDAMSLADQAGRPIEISVEEGRAWRFSVWAPLVTSEFNFTRSRTFPLFVASAVRWLAGVEAWAHYVAAGRPVRMTEGAIPSIVVAANGRPVDTGGLPIVPPAAGPLARRDAPPLSASLLSPVVTRGGGDDVLQIEPATVGSGAAPSLAIWLVMAALVLLAVEWQLYQRGRMP